MTNDNPRNLEPPLLELRRLLREVFNRPIDEWVIRWENWTVATIEKDDPLEIAQALGTIEGAVIAWGEIVTPEQAERLGKLTHALADVLVEHRRSGNGR